MNNKSILLALDKIGIGTSALCMLHCVSLPVIMVLGADSLLWFLEMEWLEHLIIICSLLIGLLSFVGGYLKHGQHFIPVLFVAGFLLLISGEAVTSTWFAVLLSVVGASVIIYAHIQNLKWKQMTMTNYVREREEGNTVPTDA